MFFVIGWNLNIVVFIMFAVDLRRKFISNMLLSNHDYIFAIEWRKTKLTFNAKYPFEPCREKTGFLPMRKSKAQNSFAVTAKLITPLFSLLG